MNNQNTNVVVLSAKNIKSKSASKALEFAFGDNPKSNKYFDTLMGKIAILEQGLGEGDGSVVQLLTAIRAKYHSDTTETFYGALLNASNWLLSLHLVDDINEHDALDALATTIGLHGEHLNELAENGDELALDFNSFFRQGFMAYQFAMFSDDMTKH